MAADRGVRASGIAPNTHFLVKPIDLKNNLPMPGNTQPSGKTSRSSRRLPWDLLTVAALPLFIVWFWVSPRNTFHPMCTYTVNAVVSAEVEVSGEKLSSTVVHQNSRSRGWISIMNSAGCKQRYGNALVYRLAGDRVLIVPARLCYAAQKEFYASGRADIMQACTGRQARQNRAFIVDSASRPKTWRPAINGSDFRLVSMTATSTWKHPADDIASIAANLLKSQFKYDRDHGIRWSDSPETVIDFARRYDLRKQRADRSFEFQVRYGAF